MPSIVLACLVAVVSVFALGGEGMCLCTSMYLGCTGPRKDGAVRDPSTWATHPNNCGSDAVRQRSPIYACKDHPRGEHCFKRKGCVMVVPAQLREESSIACLKLGQLLEDESNRRAAEAELAREASVSPPSLPFPTSIRPLGDPSGWSGGEPLWLEWLVPEVLLQKILKVKDIVTYMCKIVLEALKIVLEAFKFAICLVLLSVAVCVLAVIYCLRSSWLPLCHAALTGLVCSVRLVGTVSTRGAILGWVWSVRLARLMQASHGLAALGPPPPREVTGGRGPHHLVPLLLHGTGHVRDREEGSDLGPVESEEQSSFRVNEDEESEDVPLATRSDVHVSHRAPPPPPLVPPQPARRLRNGKMW